MERFKIGEKVKWRERSWGGKVKVGVVVGLVVKQKAIQDRIGEKERKYYVVSGIGSLRKIKPTSRNHNSYLVAVDKGEGNKPRLYWPLVKNLQRIN